MANQTCLNPVFFIQGDGVSLTATIALKSTPLVFNDPAYAVFNFPAAVDSVSIIVARDSLNNDFTAQCSISKSGYQITFTFGAPFSDYRTIHARVCFNV